MKCTHVILWMKRNFPILLVFLCSLLVTLGRTKQSYFLMKTTPVSLILAGILVPSLAMAEPQRQERRKMKPDAEDRRAHLRHFAEAWKAADKNSDGFISLDEFSAMPRIQKLPENKHQQLFERLDKDGDGKLGRDDLRRLGRDQDGPPPAMKRLWELDTDRSGGVSLEEFKAGELFQKLTPDRQLAIFQRLDTDGDGVVTHKDKPQPPFGPDGTPERQKRGLKLENPSPPIPARSMIRQLDQDSDGAIDFHEFRAGTAVRTLSEDEQEDRFEALDRDNDQKITPADFPPQDTPMKPKPSPDQEMSGN